MKIRYYLKFQLSMCHRQFFQKKSQNPEYVKTYCNDMENPFNFAIRRWMIDQ